MRWTLPLLAVVGLGVLVARTPGLALVDAVLFSARARALWEGAPTAWDLVHPLYPIGYPWVLGGAQQLVGDVLLAGKLLSVLAGGALIAALVRGVGPGAAAFVAVQLGFLAAGSTEGTDLCAAALSIAGILAARGRPVLGAALVGLGCLVRYTALAAVPALLLLAPGWRTVGTLVVMTAPHWGMAAWLGVSPWPDQSQNVAIGAGGEVPLWSWDTARRWPVGFLHALEHVELPAWIGAVGLLIGARRDPRARGLLLFVFLHLAALGLAFANPRLALPATLALAAGVAWLAADRRLLVASAVVLALRLPALVSPEVREAPQAPGACFSTSPWVHGRVDGWLVPSIHLSGLTGPRVTPAELRVLAGRHGVDCLVLDEGHRYPGLAPLFEGPVDGYTPFEVAPRWRGWWVR